MASEVRETIYGNFAAAFVEERLVNLCDPNAGIQTGPFGSQLHQEDYVSIGTPIITVEHLAENRIIHEGVPLVSDADRDRLSRYLLREGDIVFSRVGSVDRRALVRKAEDGWMFSGRCLRVRPNRDKIDAGYLSYFFGLPAFKEHIRAIAVGATMPSLNTSILSDIVVPHPPSVKEQRAIAHILGTLDDKIELIRQRNQILDAMARALFKDWFVDFGPVRAKMEGGQPSGLTPEIAELFPDALNKVGVPQGWNIGTLGDLATLNPESWSKKNPPTEIEYVDLANTKWGAIELTTRFAWADAPSRAQRILRPGDTIVGTVRPGNGSYSYVSVDGLTGSTGFAILRPKDDENRELLFLAATSSENIERLAHLADGGAYPAVRPEVVLASPVVFPSSKLMTVFSDVVAPLIKAIEQNKHEAATLGALRDILLPKLLSGEVRIRDAEHMAGDTV